MICIIDYRAKENIVKHLKDLKIEVIMTRRAFDVERPIDGHPDIVMFKLDERTLIVCPKHYDYFQSLLNPYNIVLRKGINDPQEYYPKDIIYNGVRAGRYLIHNLNYTDPAIKESAQEHHLKMIHVKQAYSKCSVINLEERGIITSDKGIYKACINEGIDSLLVSERQVDLEGYDTGLIGGASGYLNGKLYLAGSIEYFSEKERFCAFLEKKNIELIQLSKDRLYDYGTLFMFKTGGIDEENIY